MLRGAVERGHSIGRATKLNSAELEEIGTDFEGLVTARQEPPAAPAASSFDRSSMLDAVTRFDNIALGAALGRAAALLRPSEFVLNVALPLVAEVTERCRDGSDGQAERHLASAVVRNVLGSLLHRHEGGTGARLLFASLDGHHDEVPVLAAAVLAASGGLDSVYLGVDVSADDVVRAASRAVVDVVVVGVGDRTPREPAVRNVSAIARGLSPDIEVWAEGPAAGSIAGRIGARVRAIEAFSDLSAHLIRVGARLA